MTALIELCMIVRNDSRSLDRALASARPHVDTINIGIDQRTTDPNTKIVARKYTDIVWTFGAEDIGLSSEQWSANMIHFANARNIGREKARAPWVLFLDSDEYIESATDLRAIVRRYMFTNYNSLCPIVKLADFEFRDAQRLARFNLRWTSATHNQLVGAFPSAPVDVRIVQDTSLRTQEDRNRRDRQRDEGMVHLVPLAESGDQNAVYHMAKHETVRGNLEEGGRWATKYLKQTEPHSVFSDNRATLCISIALQYLKRDQIVEAEMWAVRALFDGPHADAFAVLAEAAKMRKDVNAEKTWDEAVVFAPQRDRMRIQ